MAGEVEEPREPVFLAPPPSSSSSQQEIRGFTWLRRRNRFENHRLVRLELKLSLVLFLEPNSSVDCSLLCPVPQSPEKTKTRPVQAHDAAARACLFGLIDYTIQLIW
jgi:hypothetical protein